MRVDEVGPKVYDLITSIIGAQTALPSIPIVEEYGNAPRPSSTIFISYNPSPVMRMIGKQVQYPKTDTTPVQTIVEWEVPVTVREIGGYGQYLQIIQTMQYSQVVRSFLYNECMSILRIAQIIPIPRLLDDDRWERESSMEMILAITHVVDDTTTTIDTVELNNNIGE